MKCQWCGEEHTGLKCPLVKAIEFHENGMTKRVEFIVTADLYPPAPVQVSGSAAGELLMRNADAIAESFARAHRKHNPH